MTDYCTDCMTAARRIGAATGQNVSEVYRYYMTGPRHRECHATGQLPDCGLHGPRPCECDEIERMSEHAAEPSD